MKIHEMRAALEAKRARIVELSEKPDEEITDEERAEFDAAVETYEADETELRNAEQRAALVEKVKAGKVAEAPGVSPQFMRQVEVDETADVRRLLPGEARDQALKVLERKDTTRHLQVVQGDHLDALLCTRNANTDGTLIARRLLATESDAYRRAFMKLVTRSNPVLSADESDAVLRFEELRTYMSLTDANGGYGVPVLIDPTIILTSQGSSNAVQRLARTVTITTDEWKGVSSAGVTWSFDAEATAVSDDSPTLAQPNVVVHKAQGFIAYSIEVGMDYPGFASEMSRLLAEGYNELKASAFVTGSGTNQPYGIVTALTSVAASEVTVDTDGQLNAADLYDLWDALPERFRGNATWLSSTDVMNAVRQLGTTDPNFTVNLTAAGIPQLFGREYAVTEYMADFTGTTGAADLLIVGDFSHYLIAQRAGMNVELVPHVFDVTANRPTGERAWYAWARVGADSIVDNAFRMLVNT